MAEEANQSGTLAYKTRAFVKAQKFFEQATQLDPSEPKYASNLSAVLYEQSRYVQCTKSVCRAWKALAERHQPVIPLDDILAMKLATRAAKAQVNGFFDVSLLEDSKYFHRRRSPHEKACLGAMEQYALLERSKFDAKAEEMRSFWRQWRHILAEYNVEDPHHLSNFSSERKDSQVRTNALPIFKGAIDPTLEYMRLGMDFVRSIAKGPDGKKDTQLFLSMGEGPSGRCWSFLFGGSGDGRHAFATMIELADFVRIMHPENPSVKPSAFNAAKTHITLIDVHPAAIARSIVVFSLLHDMMTATPQATAIERAEAYATVFYMFTSMVMPAYCQKRFIESVKRAMTNLEYGNDSYLRVNEHSVPAVLKVLRYWSTSLPKSTKILMQRNVGHHGSATKVAAIQGIQRRQPAECLADFKAHRDDDDVETPLHRRWHRPFRPEKPPDTYLRPYYDPEAETQIYDQISVLLPPQTLLSRHRHLEAVVKRWGGSNPAGWMDARREIQETWVPNPVLFDGISTEHPYYSTEGPWEGPSGYPLLPHPFYNCLFSFEQFCKPYVTVSDQRASKTAFAIMSRFFELAANALYTLRKSLVVEFVVGDLLADIPRLIQGELGPRPPNSPTEYIRMWLSNIPDYTNGILNPLSHLTPYMKSDGLMTFNCMRNQGMFTSLESYVSHYTFLSIDEFPRYFGCQLSLMPVNGDTYTGSSTVLQGPFEPLVLGALASRAELHDWLARLFLTTLCCGKPSAGVGIVIEMNNNLASFFRFLVHLRRQVGFPSHWLSDFVQTVLSDTLVTDVPLYSGTLPIPTSVVSARTRSRKVHLSAWQAGMQVIVTSMRLSLPFFLDLPDNFPKPRDIRTFKAVVDLSFHEINWNVYISPFIKALGLMFYPPTTRFSSNMEPPSIEDVLEGVKKETIQFILDQEHVDLRWGHISWKMSLSWYQKMKAEGWKMIAFRTDFNLIVTRPSGADKWTEI